MSISLSRSFSEKLDNLDEKSRVMESSYAEQYKNATAPKDVERLRAKQQQDAANLADEYLKGVPNDSVEHILDNLLTGATIRVNKSICEILAGGAGAMLDVNLAKNPDKLDPDTATLAVEIDYKLVPVRDAYNYKGLKISRDDKFVLI